MIRYYLLDLVSGESSDTEQALSYVEAFFAEFRFLSGSGWMARKCSRSCIPQGDKNKA